MRLVVFFISWMLVAGWAFAAAGDRPEVYVRESFEAGRALERLRRLEAESRLGEAAEGYDRLVEEAGDALVRVDSLHARNVRDYVRERLASWPAEARERYRTAFEGRAARRLEQLGPGAPAEELVALAERYWLTPAGREAARRAAAVLERERRVETARRWRKRLLEAGGSRGEVNRSDGQSRADSLAEDAGAGDSTREAVPGEVFWKVTLAPSTGETATCTGETTACASRPSSLPKESEAGAMPAVPKTVTADLVPVVVGQRVYVQSAGRLWSLRVNSGQVEWTVCARRPEEEDFAPRDCGRGGVAPRVADGRVFANLTWCDGEEVAVSRLVCVDAADGRVFWQVDASPPDPGGRFQPVEFFDGAPLVYEGRVYAVVRRRRELTFEDCRLACFDPDDGRRLWDVLIASGPTGEGRDRVMTRSDPAGGGGDVFVQTKLGAMGCVDGLSGRVRWVTLEPAATRPGPDSPGSTRDRFLPLRLPAQAGRVQPVLVEWMGPDRLRVLTVPAGSEQIRVYDAATGREMDRLDREEVGEFRHVVDTPDGWACAGGDVVVGDGVFLLSGPGELCCLTPRGAGLQRLLAQVEAERSGCAAWLDLARFSLARPAETQRGLAALEEAIACAAGRAALQEIEAEQAVRRVRERALEIAIEAARRWSIDGPPEEGAFDALLARAMEAAGGPEQQVRYRFAFAAGYERLGRVREAVRLYQEVLDDPGLRGIGCGRGFPPNGVREGAPALAEGGETEAPTGTGWRRRVAGREAERAIDRLIARHGRAVYGEFDRRAGRLLGEGLERDDPARVREAIERYPHSGVVPEALLAWMRMERRAGRPLAAVRFAQDVLRRRMAASGEEADPRAAAPASPDPSPSGREKRAEALARIAAGYFAAGDVLNGLAWLERGRREHGSDRWQEEGREETFESLRERLVGRGVEVQRDRPRAAPPLRPAYRLERPGAGLLLPQERLAGFRDAAAEERILLFDAGRLEALEPGGGKTLWEAYPVSVGTPVWLGTRGELLVFSTRYQLFALDRRDGSVRWIVGDVPRKALSAAIDPEVLTRISSWSLGETLAVVLLSDGRGAGVEIASGEVLWERVLPRKAGGPCRLNDEHVAYVAQGEPAGLVVLEAASGREVGLLPVGQAGQVLWCGFTPMRTVLVAGSDWLAGFDPYTKGLLWRVDGVQPIRAGTILPGFRGFYVAQGTGMACRSYADGKALWERELSGLAGGGAVQNWLDAGRVYVLTGRGAAALEAASGQALWAARWDDDPGVGPAWLTQRHLLRTDVRPAVTQDGESRWELRARWLDRQTGHSDSRGWELLGAFETVPDVGVCDRVLIARAGALVAGWDQGKRSSQPDP